jgi:hypothetical protein
MTEAVRFLLAGAFGALAKDIVGDGKLQLPYLKDGFLVLGVVGGMMVGAFVGWAVDGSLITAAMAGYVGTSAISHLLPKGKR